MANQIYKSFEELPVMLTIPQVASVLSISRAGAYELATVKVSRLCSSEVGLSFQRIGCWLG